MTATLQILLAESCREKLDPSKCQIPANWSRREAVTQLFGSYGAPRYCSSLLTHHSMVLGSAFVSPGPL